MNVVKHNNRGPFRFSHNPKYPPQKKSAQRTTFSDTVFTNEERQKNLFWNKNVLIYNNIVRLKFTTTFNDFNLQQHHSTI